MKPLGHFRQHTEFLAQFQHQWLVNFLDCPARENRGRKVILVSIGSASAIGSAVVNRNLSMERSEAPLPVIDHFLLIFRTGSTRCPPSPTCTRRNTLRRRWRSQSVRMIAAYDVAQLAGK
jgi:hypothetical protein